MSGDLGHIGGVSAALETSSATPFAFNRCAKYIVIVGSLEAFNFFMRLDMEAFTRPAFLKIAASLVCAVSNPVQPVETIAASPESQNISIDRASFRGAIPSALAGLSYEKANLWTGLFSPENVSLIGCFKRLGHSILRIGGNSTDDASWDPDGHGSVFRKVSKRDIDKLAAFVRSAGWRVIYGINLARNTPEVAADEAAFVSSKLGDSLYAFEIGNECDAYASKGIRAKTYTVADFISEWGSYASAIRERVPSAPLSGPASADSLKSWTLPFANNSDVDFQLLTQHYYRGSGRSPQSTLGLLLSSDVRYLDKMLEQLAAVTDANHISYGYRLDETNSFYSGGAPNVSNVYGSALWAIDFLLTLASYGCSGANFHGGGNTAGSYTPIADAHGAVFELRPLYYGMAFVSLIPPGKMYRVITPSDLPTISAYSVQADNSLNWIIVINKDSTQTITITVDTGGGERRALPIELNGPSLNSTSGIVLGGNAIETNGTWFPTKSELLEIRNSRLTLQMRPASATLLKLF